MLGFLGFIALVQGLGGLVGALTDRLRWGFVHRWSAFDGYEIYVSVVLLVLAVALFAAAESRGTG
ncbi:hypothetical protein GCM10010365_70730 [Streptomyces poonensis]|uniref:Uncharacterized protein n=1 Tax=Streptomyces poonensis TaxID=68255 RepID=A0A918UWN9_9ACTN|nr:hypothetical protein GCM10010365_70730 [Streptomyces poonensis]GLJ92911.1 hypothetical protein GCM10017589_55220 [Streptomyces poonensis]